MAGQGALETAGAVPGTTIHRKPATDAATLPRIDVA